MILRVLAVENLERQTTHSFAKTIKWKRHSTRNLEVLESHLRETTSKAIADASILETCRSIRYASDHTLAEDWDDELADIVTKQTRKGQRAFIGGLWPKKWLAVQQQYYTRYRSKKSPTVWIAKTIARTQNLFFEMWLIQNTGIYGDEESAGSKSFTLNLTHSKAALANLQLLTYSFKLNLWSINQSCMMSWVEIFWKKPKCLFSLGSICIP